jgi:hypothetical protein
MPKPAADERADKSADVDAHVKDAEAGIAACAPFGIEIADQRAGVGLEQPGAQDDEQES